MERFTYLSRLPVSLRDQLESLLFFNPEQSKVATQIELAVDRFGRPEIEESEGWLRLRLTGVSQVQTLFALDHADSKPTLAGAIIFLRSDEKSLAVLHMAVRGDYTRGGRNSEERLALGMLSRVVRIARRLRGVEQVSFLYRDGVTLKIRR